jgi:hypothetical protein
MKLKTFLICIAVIIAVGFILKNFTGNKSKQSQSSAPAEIVKTIPDTVLAPGRTLKPNEEFISPFGLYVIVPKDMTFRKEIADDEGVIHSVGFYIENSSKENPYMLYGLYEAKSVATDQTLASAKKDMVPSTIKDITIGGYKGVEGLITGDKTRYMAVIVKDGKKITFSTIPPTDANKVITDQLLSTLSFK